MSAPASVNVEPHLMFLANVTNSLEVIISAVNGGSVRGVHQKWFFALRNGLGDGPVQSGRDHSSFGVDFDIDRVIATNAENDGATWDGVMGVFAGETDQLLVFVQTIESCLR